MAVVLAVEAWREAVEPEGHAASEPPLVYYYQEENYLLKMASDLQFLECRAEPPPPQDPVQAWRDTNAHLQKVRDRVIHALERGPVDSPEALLTLMDEKDPRGAMRALVEKAVAAEMAEARCSGETAMPCP